jgi:hypothetical protein
MIVVAVPTKYMYAFSFPGLEGWSLTSLAVGRLSGTVAPLGKSRVAGRLSSGSIKIECMVSGFSLHKRDVGQ